MEFKKFAAAVNKQFNSMTSGGKVVYQVDMGKDELWDAYQDAFPEGTNEIYRTNRIHECNTCKSFIRNVGTAVLICDNGEIKTVWDVKLKDEYQVVADALSTLIKSKAIKSLFVKGEEQYGERVTSKLDENSKNVTRFYHFHAEIPSRYHSTSPRYEQGAFETNREVFMRALTEITTTSCEIVLDLIKNSDLYRGNEFKSQVKGFAKLKNEYESLTTDREKELFTWMKVPAAGSTIRNSVIGSLLLDISEGKDLEVAVKQYESKVAPQNYQRTSAPISQEMVKQAMKKVQELNLEDSLRRRHSSIDDIAITDVLFADRSVSNRMKGFVEELTESLMGEAKGDVPQYKNCDEIELDDFVANLLPEVDQLEVMVEKRHQNSFVTLVSPEDPESEGLFRWNNNFSWSYNGEVADSIKENVKKAGGNVDGVLRFSIQWNEKGDNENDLDAHCLEPKGNLIHYPNAGKRHKSSGMLDVDIVNPNGKVAVENIIYTDLSKMAEGNYTFIIHNYSHRGGKGFSAQVEFDNQIFEFSSNMNIRNGEKITVAVVNYSKANGFKMVKSLPNSRSTKEIWGVNTGSFVKVSSVMFSPNFWGGESVGNKHTFFMLDNCKNPNDIRGIYNEFLRSELVPHRKVFEVLGSKTKCSFNEDQLSGLGFSDTRRDKLICRVTRNNSTKVMTINM